MSGIGIGGFGHEPDDETDLSSKPDKLHSPVTVNVGSCCGTDGKAYGINGL